MSKANPLIIVEGKTYKLSDLLHIISYSKDILKYAKNYMVGFYDCSILFTQASTHEKLQNLATQLEKREKEEMFETTKKEEEKNESN